MAELDGVWAVERESGVLPPLLGVRKRIRGQRGVTALGPLPGVPFDVRGLTLLYRAPFWGVVDVLEPSERDPDAFSGTATFRGRRLGRFSMHRIERREVPA